MLKSTLYIRLDHFSHSLYTLYMYGNIPTLGHVPILHAGIAWVFCIFYSTE